MSCCDEMCASHGCNQGRNCPARKRPICLVCGGAGRDSLGYPCGCKRREGTPKIVWVTLALAAFMAIVMHW